MITPFLEHAFMLNAWLALCFIALMFAPLSLFLVARRMSMMGDALSHALLPGIAGAALLGLPLAVGGLASGAMIALLTPFVARFNHTHEDVAFAVIAMLSLAVGVVLLPFTGLELTHVLFGSILTLENLWILGISSLCIMSLTALAYKNLVLDTVDPHFLRVKSRFAFAWPIVFLLLLVMAFTLSFQAIGTLLSIGLMLLPHLTARLWVKTAKQQMILSAILLLVSGYFGLLFSYYLNFLPSPAILLACALLYALSLIFKGLLSWKKSP